MYKDIYDRIDELAAERNLSRRKLAQLAGINVNTLSTIFKRRPDKFPEKYLESIANALGVSVSEIRNANLRVFPKPMNNRQTLKYERIMDLYTPHSLPYGPIAQLLCDFLDQYAVDHPDIYNEACYWGDMIEALNGLTSDGRDKVLEYARDLVSTFKYSRFHNEKM